MTTGELFQNLNRSDRERLIIAARQQCEGLATQLASMVLMPGMISNHASSFTSSDKELGNLQAKYAQACTTLRFLEIANEKLGMTTSEERSFLNDMDRLASLLDHIMRGLQSHVAVGRALADSAEGA
jgi:hypothetical protein